MKIRKLDKVQWFCVSACENQELLVWGFHQTVKLTFVPIKI